MSGQTVLSITPRMRQVEVQRRNLVTMCRLTVKSLIDKSSFEPVDDNSDELVNFFAVMEQLLLFRIRPNKKWFGSHEGNHYWDYIKVACRKLPNNCITNIESIENIKSARGKGRAWLRVALMEKRLSEYFSHAVLQSRITKKFYMDGSVMLSEDCGMLCGTLLGLNSIDFSFCLKGDNLELMGPLVIDYSPYLVFHYSEEEMAVEGEERMTNSNISSIMSEVSLDQASWAEKCKRLETKYKNINEQKGYLEELVRLRQSQLDEATRQRQQLLDTLEHYECESQRERQQLEGVIIELQGQLSAVKEQLKALQRELASLRARVLPQPDSSDPSKSSLAMKEMTDTTLRLPRNLISSQDSDVQSQDSADMSGHLMVTGDHTLMLTRSVGKEETQSLLPLAGSFSSEVSFRSGDVQMTKAESGDGKTTSMVEGGNVAGPVVISVSDASPVEQRPEVLDKRLISDEEMKVEHEANTDAGEEQEVRSSPDGEVSEEDKTLLTSIVKQQNIPDGQDDPKSGDESVSSDDAPSPPREMTVEETSSDNSNGEWTLLPRNDDQQDQSSTEELAIPDETPTENDNHQEEVGQNDVTNVAENSG